MPQASVKRLIECKKKDLINLVLDIEKYPEFIPFCFDAKIYENYNEGDFKKIIADLTIGKGPLPIVKSAIIFVKSPSFLFSCIFASKQKGTNSGYFSISKTNSIKSFFLHSINRLTEALGINDYLFYFVEV